MPLSPRKLLVGVLLALLVCPASSLAQEEHPLSVSDPQLQRALDRSVAELGLASLAGQRRFAVALVDLSGATPAYAAVNGDEMMYAASLPKIAILLGAFAALEDGEIPDTPGLRRQMQMMSRVSDNAAATDVLRQVGFAGVAETLIARTNKLYDSKKGGGLWVGKAYGRDDYWVRDPVGNLSHGATARQVARYFLMLDHGELVSPRVLL